MLLKRTRTGVHTRSMKIIKGISGEQVIEAPRGRPYGGGAIHHNTGIDPVPILSDLHIFNWNFWEIISGLGNQKF